MFEINKINLDNRENIIKTDTKINRDYSIIALSESSKILEDANINLVTMAKSIINGEPIDEAVKLYVSTNIIAITQSLSVIKKMIDDFNKEKNDFFKDRKIFIESLKEVSEKTFLLGKSSLNVEGFFYTEMKNPNINLASEFKSGYVDLIDKDINVVYSKLYDIYHNSYMEFQRGKVLNMNSKLSEKSFKDESYKYYRNNTTKESVVIYRQSDIEDMINKYINNNIYIDNLSDLYDDLSTQCMEVIRCLNLLTEDLCTKETLNNLVYGQTSKYVDMEGIVPEGFNDCIGAITKMKSGFIPGFMTCYIMTIADKINAMKKSMVQNTIVLDSFIKYIFTEGGNQ